MLKFGMLGGLASSPAYGYVFGGAGTLRSIESIKLDTEAVTLLSATLDGDKQTATSYNSADKGYVAGGSAPTNKAIDDITFGTDVSVRISATLWTNCYGGGSGMCSSVKGYTLGGYNTGYLSTIYALTFSDETSAQLSATADIAKVYRTGANSDYKAYGAGGYSNTTRIEDIIFADETSQTLTAVLSLGRNKMAGCDSSEKAYFMGGKIDNGNDTAKIDSLQFSDETYQAVTATLDAQRECGVGVNSGTKGYCIAGYYETVDTNTIEDIIFTDETSQIISAVLNNDRTESQGCQSGRI